MYLIKKLSAFVTGILVISLPATAQLRTPEELGILEVPQLSQPDCKKIDYAPIDAYDAPSGIKVGQLILDNPQWAIEDLPSCKNRPKVQFLPNGSYTGFDIKTISLKNNHFSIPYYAVKEMNSHIWAQVKSNTTYYKYWIKVSPQIWIKDYATTLVQGVDQLSEICEEPGKNCRAASFALNSIVRKAGNDRENCYHNAYDIINVIKDDQGKQYYLINLAKELQAAYPQLPVSAIIPVYDRYNRWTGFVYWEGCASESLEKNQDLMENQ